MKKKKFPFLQLGLAALVAFGIARGYYRLTDDFRIGNMTYSMVHNPNWDVDAMKGEEREQFHAILDQNFSYIGKGAQSYAFVSADGKYVLKFFKFKHLKPSWFVDMLPNCFPFQEYRDRQVSRKRRKLLGVFDGYRLAYEQHRKESGLIYVHLNVTEGAINKQVNVTDKIGINRTIDLDSVIFVLQECATTSRNVILGQLKKGRIEEAMASIYQLLDLYRSEYAKGILDHDHGVMHNTGFVGSRPIHLDVGKLHSEPEIMDSDNALQDLTKVAVKIARKVREQTPKYYAYVVKEMESYISDAYKKKSFSLEEQGAAVGFPL